MVRMRMLERQLFVFLIIYVSESSCVIDALYDAGKKVCEFYSILDRSNLTSSVNPRRVDELFGDDYASNEKIRHQMYEIHVQLREIENSINSEIMDNLIKIMTSKVMTVKCVDQMRIFITSIDDNYKKFYQIIIQDGYIYNRPLNDLITSVFPDIESNIRMIRKIMTDSKELLLGEPNLMTAINGYARTRYNSICNSYQSIDEILIHLFKVVIIAEIKSNLMWAFKNLHTYREPQEWKIMNVMPQWQFQKYFATYVNLMQQNLDLTRGLYMRACDPEDGAWVLNENYYELDGIIQAIIFRYQPTVCPFQSCQNIWQERATQCNARYYDFRSGCSSTPTNCEDFGVMQACVLKEGPHKFQYVNSTEFGFLGHNSTCPKDDGYIIDNSNGSNAGYATCGCYCDGNHNKISFVIMESTGDSNKKVITGLRFKRQNNTLHIQPRVGELTANGYIQRNSERWLRIPENIDSSQIHRIDKHNSFFFLDDVVLPTNFVLTGTRFNKVRRGSIIGFAIEIFGVPYDYRSGQLDLGGRIRLSPSRDFPGEPLIFDPISSLQTNLHNTPSSPDVKYVQLKRSHLKSDFGQSMLPLFDAVPITTDPPSPLGGFGIFHKGIEGYAGFISLRAYGIRYEQYFENFTAAHTIKGRLQIFT